MVCGCRSHGSIVKCDEIPVLVDIVGSFQLLLADLLFRYVANYAPIF
jgi:hypothetical protein